MSIFAESEIEIFSLDELKQLGFSYIRGSLSDTFPQKLVYGKERVKA